MKKLLIIIISAASLVFIANSCKKTGGAINPLSDVKNLAVGSYLVRDSTINLNLDNSKILTSTVGVTVSYYKGGEAVDHILLYCTSGASYDTAKWHLVKTVPYSGSGTKLTVNGQELATVLGVDPSSFVPGDSYTFYTRLVTKTGRTFDVNNTGNNAGSGLVTGPTYFSAYYFTTYITCPFVGPVAGSYKVLVDDKADWAEGDIVQVTDGPGVNQINLSQVYPHGPNSVVDKPLIVNINPVDGTAKIPNVSIGSYSAGGVVYTAVGGNENDVAGFVFSCTGYITLLIDFSAGDKDLGTYRLVLQKQ